MSWNIKPPSRDLAFEATPYLWSVDKGVEVPGEVCPQVFPATEKRSVPPEPKTGTSGLAELPISEFNRMVNEIRSLHSEINDLNDEIKELKDDLSYTDMMYRLSVADGDMSLFKHAICRALGDHFKQYRDTTEEDIINAIKNLVAHDTKVSIELLSVYGKRSRAKIISETSEVVTRQEAV